MQLTTLFSSITFSPLYKKPTTNNNSFYYIFSGKWGRQLFISKVVFFHWHRSSNFLKNQFSVWPKKKVSRESWKNDECLWRIKGRNFYFYYVDILLYVYYNIKATSTEWRFMIKFLLSAIRLVVKVGSNFLKRKCVVAWRVKRHLFPEMKAESLWLQLWHIIHLSLFWRLLRWKRKETTPILSKRTVSLSLLPPFWRLRKVLTSSRNFHTTTTSVSFKIMFWWWIGLQSNLRQWQFDFFFSADVA